MNADKNGVFIAETQRRGEKALKHGGKEEAEVRGKKIENAAQAGRLRSTIFLTTTNFQMIGHESEQVWVTALQAKAQIKQDQLQSRYIYAFTSADKERNQCLTNFSETWIPSPTCRNPPASNS